MNPETDETWPPAPSIAEDDSLEFRTDSIALTIVDGVLTFQLRFIRRFIAVFSLAIILVIPAVMAAVYYQTYGSTPPAGATLVTLYSRRIGDLATLVGTVFGTLTFLYLIFEFMLSRGWIQFDPRNSAFWAGICRHSLGGLVYFEVRPQVSKTKTWTRYCFFLGFNRNVASTFDLFNPLHRLAAWYAGARRNEYYLGYTADPGGAHRAGHAIAQFLDVEFRKQT